MRYGIATTTIIGEEEQKTFKREYADTVDHITYTVLILFTITIFQNITYLNSPDPATAQLALTSMALALICIFGIALKTFFDNLGITKSQFKSSTNDLWRMFVFFGIIFGIQFVVFFLILQVAPIQSVFALGLNFFVFAVISSTSEEFFFAYTLQATITRYTKFWGVFIIAGVFMYYHWVVYASTPILLLLMFIFRLVYGSVYYYSRRLSSLILAHLLTNMLGLASIA